MAYGHHSHGVAARVILSNGFVVDMVGTVHLQVDTAQPLIGADTWVEDGMRNLRVTMRSRDFRIYLPGEQAPEHNDKLRALPSGADRLPLERVDGEILPED